MLAEYVLRGLKAGVLAGLVFGLFVALVANPLVAFADELGHGETAIEAGHEHDGSSGDGVVPSAVTNAVSVVSGVLWGILLGATVFGAGFYLLEPILPGGPKSVISDSAMAAAGFLSVSGVPWLLLPPQPPGVQQFLAVSTRIRLYAGLLLLGTVCCLLALFVFDRLSRKRGRSTALAAVTALLPFGLLAVPVVLAPANPVENPLPPELSAGLVGMTVFGQLLLWAVLASAHAWLRRGPSGESLVEPNGSTIEPDGSTADRSQTASTNVESAVSGD